MCDKALFEHEIGWYWDFPELYQYIKTDLTKVVGTKYPKVVI